MLTTRANYNALGVSEDISVNLTEYQNFCTKTAPIFSKLIYVFTLIQSEQWTVLLWKGWQFSSEQIVAWTIVFMIILYTGPVWTLSSLEFYAQGFLFFFSIIGKTKANSISVTQDWRLTIQYIPTVHDFHDFSDLVNQQSLKGRQRMSKSTFSMSFPITSFAPAS